MAERIDTPLAPLIARLLGQTELRLGDRLLTDADWPRRSARHLLLLLLVSPGHALPRDRVVDLIWPEAAPQTAANVVALAVHRLRRALEPALDSGRASRYVETAAGTIRLHLPAGSRVDADAFEADLRDARRQPGEGRREPLRAALAGYAGDLVADEPYVDWLVARREQLAQLRQGAAVELAALDLAAGEPLAAEPALLDLLRDDPSLEDAHRALIRAYAAAGQQERAERQLAACRSALREHLGVEPAPETLAAVDRVLVIGPAPVKGRGRVPGPPTRLIGRHRELERIADLILGGESRLVTLVGPGGIGKTHLAQEAAKSLDDDFADGAVWVPLATLRDPTLVPAALARALDVTDDGGTSLEETLVQAVADRALLLVVDNLEQVLDGAPILARLLASSPGSAVLATSRQRLHLRGEHVLEVEPLPPATDGVALFLARAVEAGVHLPTGKTLSAVAELCRRLDGIPLAIELAAGAARRLSVETILARLGRRLDLLVDGPRDADPRQRTMREAIAWSDDLLTPSQHTTFRRLGIFAGGAPRDLIDQIVASADAPSLSLPATTDVDADLLALVEAHLLRRDDGGETPRFLMLETVRAYAVERLVAAGELPAVAAAHVAAFVDLAVRADDEFNGPRRIAALDRLEDDHDNLRAAVTWSVDQGSPVDALRIVGGGGTFFSIRGHRMEWVGRIEHALTVAEDVDPLVESGALYACGMLLEDLRDLSGAERRYAAGLACLSKIPADAVAAKLRCRHLTGLAVVAEIRGQVVDARARYQEALEVADEFALTRVTLTSGGNLGRIAIVEGDLDEADRRFAAVLDATDDPYLRLRILQNLARVAVDRGDYRAVRSLATEGLVLAREAGDLTSIASLHIGLGLACAGLDESGGVALLEDAVARSIALSDTLLELEARREHAAALRREGDHLGAIATIARALEIQRRFDDDAPDLDIIEELVPSLVHLGRAERASRLVGATAARRAADENHRLHRARSLYEGYLAGLTASIPAADHELAMAGGAGLSLEAMFDDAIAVCGELLAAHECAVR